MENDIQAPVQVVFDLSVTVDRGQQTLGVRRQAGDEVSGFRLNGVAAPPFPPDHDQTGEVRPPHVMKRF